jgi:hypothetical protein
MQAAPQQATQKCSDLVIQSDIANARWNEKQGEIQAAFNRQQTVRSLAVEHEHFMVDHLATPIMFVCIVAIIAATVVYLVRKAIAAGIEKNRDDSASDVRRAQEILYKHEAGA